MNVLLICATADFDIWERSQDHRAGETVRRAFTVPLHLGTVAALTPSDYHVVIWDESARGRIDDDTDFDIDFDVVGVTAYYTHLPRARELAAVFRKRGIPVVIGGAGVTSNPESCRDHFDVLFLGEAEQTWPQFLADFREGNYLDEYRAEEFPDLSESPAPRWDSIANSMSSNFLTGGVQVNRGCPFTCEFCNIWIDFGRQIRTKPIDQVLRELEALERLGMERVLLCSDNFVGNPKYAKELMRHIIPLNNSFERPLKFYTELTLNISRDEEMLTLLADTNFTSLFIGIESANEESLKETRKRHNIRHGLLEQCRKIHAYGVPIQGSMIVGFDHDTVDSFNSTFEFLQEACIVYPQLNLLKAIFGTDLMDRLVAEGRVVDLDRAFDVISPSSPIHHVMSNIVPMNMTRAEMFAGYLDLVEKVWDWKNFEARLLGFLNMIERTPKRTVDEVVIDRMKTSFRNFPGVDLDVVEHVIAYTEKHHPTMIGDVCSLILLEGVQAAQLPEMRKALKEQIERERELGDTPPLLRSSSLRVHA